MSEYYIGVNRDALSKMISKNEILKDRFFHKKRMLDDLAKEYQKLYDRNKELESKLGNLEGLCKFIINRFSGSFGEDRTLKIILTNKTPKSFVSLVQKYRSTKDKK